jgi:hypothetical protein
MHRWFGVDGVPTQTIIKYFDNKNAIKVKHNLRNPLDFSQPHVPPSISRKP